ncbi:MAG: hypothetical protein ACE5I3_07890, partial [Phycisphaerae bacterium]
ADLELMLPQIVNAPGFLEAHKIKTRNTSMECGRLEVIFDVPDQSRGPLATLDLRPSLQLSLFNARENVYLRDQQEATTREVYAHQLEFNRPQGVIRVLGSPEDGTNAKVYEENKETGRVTGPIAFPEIIIDLKTNTIRGKRIRGQAGGK